MTAAEARCVWLLMSACMHALTGALVQAFIKNVTTGKLSKGDKLGMVDHATQNYPPFRRNFYIEVPELARMSEAEVTELRKQLDNVKVCLCSASAM